MAKNPGELPPGYINILRSLFIAGILRVQPVSLKEHQHLRGAICGQQHLHPGVS